MQNEDTAADFLAIDRLRLDREWLHQSELYFRYATRLADARREADEAKSEYDVTVAEVDQAIRTTPSDYDLEGKPTEAAIRNTIPQQKEVKLANAVVIKALHRVHVIEAAVTALEHRKRALTKLVDLYISGYFADPKITASGDARRAVEEGRKREVRRMGIPKDKGEEDDEPEGT